MLQHHYPDVSVPHRWRFLGSKAGQLTEEFFQPETLNIANAAKKSWLWIDELVPSSDAILQGAHSPHEYSGYDLNVRKQPVITKFTNHDHLIIPDLDAEVAGDQTISIIVYTDFIWTRRCDKITGLDHLLDSIEFKERIVTHETAAYAFTGILRVMLDSLNQQLMLNERQTYAMEDLFLQRERGDRGDRADVEKNMQYGKTSENLNPLAALSDFSDSRKLVELRIHIAWIRKQFDAFERVVNALFDPAQGAFHQAHGTALEDEVQPYFQHLSSQIKRALTKVAHLRDIHQSLDQLLVSEQAERTNQTLLRLTWVSVILLPAVVIAGVFGMNISLFSNPNHEFGLDSGIAFGSLVFAVSMTVMFYRRESRRDTR